MSEISKGVVIETIDKNQTYRRRPISSDLQADMKKVIVEKSNVRQIK